MYDMGELYKHLREEHWACTVCQRDRGIQHTCVLVTCLADGVDG